MHLLHPRLYASCVLAAASLPAPLYAQTPALAGQWQFQTATGTSTTNGVEVDLIDTGILDIIEDQGSLRATISWIDERGQLTSPRTVNGTPGPAGTVFRHGGKRVSTGRNGKEVSTEVTIRWTLQAKGKVLSGERLVETDENEPRPVTGTRLKERYVPPALAAALPGTAARATARSPSTPAERARVLQIAAQHDPLALQQRDGAWLSAWIDAIPDLTFDASMPDDWLSTAPHAGHARGAALPVPGQRDGLPN
jgi:carboxypeptidase Q